MVKKIKTKLDRIIIVLTKLMPKYILKLNSIIVHTSVFEYGGPMSMTSDYHTQAKNNYNITDNFYALP